MSALPAGPIPPGGPVSTPPAPSPRTSCGTTPERFPAVELNTTGYRLPREELFERWAEQTPPGFLFAPEAERPRARRLRRRSPSASACSASGSARSASSWPPARDEGLLALVLGSFDPSLSLALDLRHDSWDGIEADLPPNAVRVNALEAEAPFRYLRLREPPYSRGGPPRLGRAAYARCSSRAFGSTATSSTRTSRPRRGMPWAARAAQRVISSAGTALNCDTA